MSKDPSNQEINEKLDEILGYIRMQKWMGRIKAVIWLILIVFLVIIPVYFTYSFLQAPSKYIDIPALEPFREFLENSSLN